MRKSAKLRAACIQAAGGSRKRNYCQFKRPFDSDPGPYVLEIQTVSQRNAYMPLRHSNIIWHSMLQGSFDSPKPPMPFVGRQEDVAWLERHADSRLGFDFGNDVSITGEAGIGKTALVAEFVNRNVQRQFAVWIDCGAWDSSSPHFESIFRSRQLEEELRRSRRPRGLTVVLDGLDKISERRAVDLFYGVRNWKVVSQVITTSRSRPQLRILEENRRELARLSKTEIDQLIHEKVSLADLDEKETLRLIETINGHPAAAQIMAGLARSISSEQLRRVLSGEIYEIGDTRPEMSAAKIGRVVKPLIVADNEKILRNLKKRPTDLFKLTPRQFEEVIADLLQDMGYEVTLTQQTRDGGKDILAQKKTEIGTILCLVDAKRYKQTFKIGVGMVRTLLGTLADYNATSAMLATTSTYSKDARAMEEKHKYKLTLKDYVDIVEWVHEYGEQRMHASPAG